MTELRSSDDSRCSRVPFCQPKSRATRSLVCDRHTNRCSIGCKDGFSGKKCRDGCSSRCRDLRCNQTTGHCMKCVKGYFKETCHQRCYNFSHCRYDVCEMKTFLYIECKVGYHGVDCKQTSQSGRCGGNGGHCIDIPQMTTFGMYLSLSIPQSTMNPLVFGLVVFGAITVLLMCILSYRLSHVSGITTSGQRLSGLLQQSKTPQLSARARGNSQRSEDTVQPPYSRNTYNEINEKHTDPPAVQPAVKGTPK
ncbi:scavenger receptor class F member 2-like [Haliotis asinina]|uniref:scavenger receptor class F member 2-like n=1 Tax=Haliotis asinina TaxID=109174 RepID=UPI003531C590